MRPILPELNILRAVMEVTRDESENFDGAPVSRMFTVVRRIAVCVRREKFDPERSLPETSELVAIL